MKTIDRYIFKSFLGMFLGSLVTVAFLFTALSVLDGLTYLMGGKGASFFAIVRYYSLQLPQTVYMTAPVSALLASMITLGAMNQRYEIMAIRAGGISIARAALPIIVSSVLIAGALFVLGDTLVPYGNRYFLSQKEKLAEEKPKKEKKNKKGKPAKPKKAAAQDDDSHRIWYVSESGHGGPVILRLDHVGRETGSINGFSAFRLTPQFELKEQVTAFAADYGQQKGWLLWGAGVRRFNGLETPSLEAIEEYRFELPDTPADLMRVQRAPEEMSLAELSAQIERIHRYGLPDHAYRVERQARFAIPLAAVILVLVGSPLAIRPVRSTGLAVSILGAVIVGFAYYVIIAEFISLGKGGLVSPVLAAWTANLLFGIAGAGMFSGLRK